MRTPLKAKSAFRNEDVAAVWNDVEGFVTRDEAAKAVDKAVAEVQRIVGSRRDDVVYGWSGGKDSQALQVVMEKVGIRRAVCGMIPNLEFHGYLSWLEDHRFDGLTVYENTALTPQWLGRSANDRYLFPRNAKDGYFWTMGSARYAQYLYQDEHHPALQIYGRRTRDGNSVGGADGIARTKRLTVYNPLRFWTHEMVLAVVRYAEKPLPPIYGQPNGWKTGTGCWPGRRVGTREQSWAETYAIEADRVREAAEFVPSARKWLERIR